MLVVLVESNVIWITWSLAVLEDISVVLSIAPKPAPNVTPTGKLIDRLNVDV